MLTFVAVAIGGAVGAMLRHGVNLASLRWLGLGFPWGTFVENVLGCFLMGIAATIFAAKAELAPEWRALIATGLLGGFTTFSAFSLETALMIERGQMGVAALYALLSVCLALLALFGGLFTMRAVA